MEEVTLLSNGWRRHCVCVCEWEAYNKGL